MFWLGVWSVGLAPCLVDFRDDTGSDGLASLSEGESRTRLERNVVHEVSDHLYIVTGHDLLAEKKHRWVS